MAKANSNMNSAKKAKNDEFYTMLTDIEKELRHYRSHFKGKTVFLNCDDPTTSNFWFYFANNFEFLGLKKLIATHFHRERPTYKLEISGDTNGDGKIDGDDLVKTPLKCNGDFRSPECTALLEEADIVVTNPPFSLFREYVAQLIEYDKQFLIIGNINAITYKEIFPLIQHNQIWLGTQANVCMHFVIPNSYEKFTHKDAQGRKVAKVPAIAWYTNLPHYRRNEKLILVDKYSPEKYPTYDNYPAINVDKVADIPADYDGEMGVPITFLTKYNPDQFRIIGLDEPMMKAKTGKTTRFYVQGIKKYARTVIQKL